MKKILFFVLAVAAFGGSAYCFTSQREEIAQYFKDQKPKEWGVRISGVKASIDTSKSVIALTFDACGSKTDGYDSKLIDFLRAEKIPATLFIGGKWIDKFPLEFKELSQDKLFEIENHGLKHRPLSVTGRKAYGIKGTRNPAEVFEEVEKNALKIESITGKKPKFFRSGTAFYDDVAIKMVRELGYIPVGFTVNGDQGATASKEQIKKTLINAPSGSIVIFHMNRPEKGTFEGLREALPELRRKSMKFVKLEDVNLK